jgi:predicted metal-dependent HD superfamily phosphohydrolase
MVDTFGELRFKSLWKKVDAKGSADKAYKQLIRLYTQPLRKYHNIQHILLGLGTIDRFADKFKDLNLVTLAWFYHDAIYNVLAKDNEKKSAELFQKTFIDAGLSADFAKKGYDLILTTKHNGIAKTKDQRLFVDVDIAGLANPRELYKAYSVAVKSEYTTGAGISRKEHLAMRKKFLTNFLAKEHIYSTEEFRVLYEEKARKNLKAELVYVLKLI